LFIVIIIVKLCYISNSLESGADSTSSLLGRKRALSSSNSIGSHVLNVYLVSGEDLVARDSNGFRYVENLEIRERPN
jgi:hypothetical protein